MHQHTKHTHTHTHTIDPAVGNVDVVGGAGDGGQVHVQKKQKKNENYHDETPCNDHTKEGKRSEGETEKKKKINMKRGNTEERLRSVTISLSCNF